MKTTTIIESNGIPKHAIWLMFNPYSIMGDIPKPFTPRDLHLNEIFKDDCGNFYEVVELGGAGFFGKDSYSWMWIKIRKLATPQFNINRFCIIVTARNKPYKTGGVCWHAWVNTLSEAIEMLPEQYRKPDAGKLHYCKMLMIEEAFYTDLETGNTGYINPTWEDHVQLRKLAKK